MKKIFFILVIALVVYAYLPDSTREIIEPNRFDVVGKKYKKGIGYDCKKTEIVEFRTNGVVVLYNNPDNNPSCLKEGTYTVNSRTGDIYVEGLYNNNYGCNYGNDWNGTWENLGSQGLRDPQKNSLWPNIVRCS